MQGLRRGLAVDSGEQRSVWLAIAADYAIRRTAILVGGAAANLYTGSYRPTDVDLCAYLDHEDRQSMSDVGFVQLQDDHFAYTFGDGERWLLEFPDSQVDGDVQSLQLDPDNQMTVITLESLIVERIGQKSNLTSPNEMRLSQGPWKAFSRASQPDFGSPTHRHVDTDN